jgi:hypothetical protein
MVTLHRRRQWRDKLDRPNVTLEEWQQSNRYIGVLCFLAGLCTVLTLLILILKQPFIDAFIDFLFGSLTC